MRSTILIVDSEALVRNMLAKFLGDDGYAVETAPTGTGALDMARKIEFVPVDHMDEVLAAALEDRPRERLKPARRPGRTPARVVTAEPR